MQRYQITPAHVELLSYIVPKLCVEAVGNPPTLQGDKCVVPPSAIAVKTGEKEEDANWYFSIEVSSLSTPEALASTTYRFSVVVVGRVRILEEAMSDPKKLSIAKISGLSLLYSAAREVVLAATEKGPYPPVLLPTIRFVPVPATKTDVVEVPAKLPSSRATAQKKTKRS